jgi:general stress protein YciG
MARNTSSKRGFAAMTAEKQREIAAKGGRASHGSRKKKKESMETPLNAA